MIPKKDEIYKHFKGDLYKIITMAQHSETGEQMVVYQGLYGDQPVFCRPLAMFVSEVDHEKYPDATQKQRFELMEGMEEEAGEADPAVLEFLDAQTNQERRNILASLHHRITNEMIDMLAVVMDVVIKEGEVEERYQQLKKCLDTIDKYEIER